MTPNAEQKKAIQAMIDKAHAAGNLDDVDALEHLRDGRDAALRPEGSGVGFGFPCMDQPYRSPYGNR